MIDETRIQFALSTELLSRGHQYVMPNISWSWLYWEADLISFTKAGYMNEFEIKISHADFVKDFSKRKHQHLRRGGGIRTPNYFWYVAPLKAIPVCIPDYAGLILVGENGRYKNQLGLKFIKKPKLLHKVKVPDKGVFAMLRAMMFKYWDLAKTLDRYKLQRDLIRP